MSLASKGVPTPLLTTLSALNSVGACACPASSVNHTVYITPNGTVSGGTVSIEEAKGEDYTGTWSVITTFTATAGLGVVHIQGHVRAIRAKLTAAITGGGTVTVEYSGI